MKKLTKMHPKTGLILEKVWFLPIFILEKVWFLLDFIIEKV